MAAKFFNVDDQDITLLVVPRTGNSPVVMS